ncbi:hypothetical protein BH09ACT3_BH09ACT3_05320 [soil metagenome]
MIRRVALATAVAALGLLAIGAAPAAAAEQCSIVDADLRWGFKESFRSYLTSTIANGQWVVDGGAGYSTPEFQWMSGSGFYDPDSASGLVAFIGSVTFTGHGGVLSTRIANPELQFVDSSTAYLLLDVAGTTQGGEAVDLTAVRFAGLDLEAGRRSAEAVTVPAVLTAEGAEAFGTYPAGEPLDPVEYSLDASCQAAAGPPADLAWLSWAVAGLGAAALAAVLALVLLRRTRSS